ncbi:hypothetical protein EKO04_005063 [Ascochyta lentis]|uniref:Uncharacterized protein n=1 Tax=Ascochyta lentis TaxID=205686 RepID=A0A8H7J558_9PLEO|nr:hypothetical protein EKO04_005063 [Ascochyta lentis]
MNSRATKGTGGASHVGGEHPPNHAQNLPEEHQNWELLLSGMEDFPQSCPDSTTLSPFPMDNFDQFRTEGYFISVDDIQDHASATSRVETPNRETLKGGVEVLNTPSSMDFEQVSDHGYQCSSHSQPSQTPNSQKDLSFASIGIYAATSPLASPVDTIDICTTKHAKGSNEVPIPHKVPFALEEEPCHCNCSQAALACLDNMSTVPSVGRYKQHLDAIHSALLTAEKLVLCTTCTPNMITAKCCFVLGNAHELTTDMSSQLREVVNSTGVTRQVREDIRRVKRRAAMLFAGLGMLQDLESKDWGLSKVQSEFLLGLARSWSSLPEP